MRLKSLVLATVAAGALASPALALAQSAPSLTDPAGDAVDSYGRTVAAADLRAASLRIEGDDLVLRTSVTSLANIVSAGSSLTFPVENVGSQDIGQIVSLGAEAGQPVATGYVGDADNGPFGGTGGVPIYGSTTTDVAAGTLTARFTLADVNAALDAREARRIEPGTVVPRITGFAGAQQRSLLLPRIGNDTAFAVGPFAF